MAYAEKKTAYEETTGFEPILKLVRQILTKWWVIALFAITFAASGFGVAKLTYSETYTSQIIFNVSNKSKDVIGSGSTGMITTASDAQASAILANNFKTLIQTGNDFITKVQGIVESTTGKKYDIDALRRLISVEVVTDSTLIKVTVNSGDSDLTYAVATAIQSVYPQFMTDVFQTADISIADNATKSQLANDSSALIYTILGFGLGGALAVLIVLISAKIQNKLLSVEDIKNNFNMNIIASVSDIKIKKKNEKTRLLITDKNVGLPFIETFKLIRTKIENVKLKKGFSVFAVTSSTESEGKTTCSVNTALSLAKSGKSVLLIDADLRKPAVCKTLGISIEGEKGIYDIVTGNKTFEESVKYIEKLNLYLLVTSVAVRDPSETLASEKMAEIIKQAKDNFDYVIVDCPPAGVVADAAIVANYTDSVVFVTAEEKVAIPQIEYALSDLTTAKSEILGCIYNRAGSGNGGFAMGKTGGYFSNRYGGYYGSSYYYGSRGSSYYYGTQKNKKHKKHKRK